MSSKDKHSSTEDMVPRCCPWAPPPRISTLCVPSHFK